FFASGKLVRTYLISELVDYPSLLPHSVSHFEWSANMDLDDDKLQYSVSTQDWNRFTFDMRTGEVVSATHLVRRVLWGVVAFILASIFGLLWFMVRKRRRNLAYRATANDQLQQMGPA